MYAIVTTRTIRWLHHIFIHKLQFSTMHTISFRLSIQDRSTPFRRNSRQFFSSRAVLHRLSSNFDTLPSNVPCIVFAKFYSTSPFSKLMKKVFYKSKFERIVRATYQHLEKKCEKLNS